MSCVMRVSSVVFFELVLLIIVVICLGFVVNEIFCSIG